MNQINKTDKRIYARKHFKRDFCLSSKELRLINCKAVDITKLGLGVLVNDETIQLKKGDTMFTYIEDMDDLSRAEVKWTKKDNSATRVGLKLFSNLLY